MSMQPNVHYTFDNYSGNILYDEMGNYTGTMDDVLQTNDGYDHAFKFQGSVENPSYVTCGNAYLASNMSVSFWFRIEAGDTGTVSQPKLFNNGNGANDGFYIRQNLTIGAILITVLNSGTSYYSAWVTYTSGWNHLVFTYQEANTAGNFYLNGSLESSFSCTMKKETSTTFMRLGAGWSTAPSVQMFRGYLSDFRIYNTVLSADVVSDLYKYPTIRTCIKQNQFEVFRRLYIKRRISLDYEDDWQEVDSKQIRKYGTIKNQVDDVRVNFYKYSGLNFTIDNYNGYFGNIDESKSLFYGADSVYRTKVKVEAGYKTPNGIEYPSNPILFTGIIGGNMTYPENNLVNVKADHLSKIFEEFPANQLITSSSIELTASEIIERARDYQDSEDVYYFRKFITSASWYITATTTDFTLSSNDLQGETLWSLFQKLAEAENMDLSFNGKGEFYFRSATAIQASATFHFSGLNDSDRTYGHNVMKGIKKTIPYSKIYNRVRVKHDKDETTTSFELYEEDWSWGDSTSSYLYGVRSYEFENIYMNSETALSKAEDIYNKYVNTKEEVIINTKPVPHLNLNDRVDLTYKTKVVEGDYLWNKVNWNEGLWGDRQGYNINYETQDFRITQISHDLDRFYSTVELREI